MTPGHGDVRQGSGTETQAIGRRGGSRGRSSSLPGLLTDFGGGGFLQIPREGLNRAQKLLAGGSV